MATTPPVKSHSVAFFAAPVGKHEHVTSENTLQILSERGTYRVHRSVLASRTAGFVCSPSKHLFDGLFMYLWTKQQYSLLSKAPRGGYVALSVSRYKHIPVLAVYGTKWKRAFALSSKIPLMLSARADSVRSVELEEARASVSGIETSGAGAELAPSPVPAEPPGKPGIWIVLSLNPGTVSER
jgi:hypothetical protein